MVSGGKFRDHRGIIYTRLADPDADPDKDGLNNLTEYKMSTNPNKEDSDSDGIPDGERTFFGVIQCRPIPMETVWVTG